MSCHGLVEGAPSIYGLDHWQCYQKACYIVHYNAPKWVLTSPLLLSCTFLRLYYTCSSNPKQLLVNNNIGKSTSASDNKNPYMRTNMAKRRANEDSECRQERLTKQCRYEQQQQAAQKKCTEE